MIPYINFDLKGCLIMCCADHGVSEEKVSAFDSEVTAQMVKNYLIDKGAAANAFSKYAQLDMITVDVGVKKDLNYKGLLNRKIDYGTKNITKGSAMTHEQMKRAVAIGMSLTSTLHDGGYNCFLLGEMGISNTTSSAAIVSMMLNLKPEEVTGYGTNISDEMYQHKIEVVRRAIEINERTRNPFDALKRVGGFEIATMMGIILEAQENNSLVILDGFNNSVAALLACLIEPKCRDNLIATHIGREPGHKYILDFLMLKPMLNLNLALGEAIGSSIIYKILKSKSIDADEDEIDDDEIEIDDDDEDDDFEIELSVYSESGADERYTQDEEEDFDINFKSMDDTNIAVTDRTFNFYLNTMPYLDRSSMDRCRQHMDELTKPVGSLGVLEEIVEQIAGISGEFQPASRLKTHLICFTNRIDEAKAFKNNYEDDDEEKFLEKNIFGAIYDSAEKFNIEMTLAQVKDGEYTKAFDFGRMTAEDISFKVPIIGIMAVGNEDLDYDAYELLNDDGSLKYDADEFLKYVPQSAKNLLSSVVGAIVAATHNSSLVIVDAGAVDIAARYLEKLLPATRPYILHAEKLIADGNELINGEAVNIGIEIVRASLYGISEMKTFKETGVNI